MHAVYRVTKVLGKLSFQDEFGYNLVKTLLYTHIKEI